MSERVLSVNLRFTVAAAVATALGSLALWPIFESAAWLPPSLVAVTVVALVGWAMRARSLPIALIPIIQAAALLIAAMWMLCRTHLWAGVVPTTSSLRDLRTLLQTGLIQVGNEVPPVNVTLGMIAVTVIALGLLALVVDAAAVTLRSPLIAALPLLAVYLVPAAVIHSGTPWWTFVPGAVGWLLILGVESREETMTWAPHAAGVTRSLSDGASARRTGLAALALAVVIPLLLPGFSEPIFGHGTGSGGDGLAIDSSAVTLNPLASLKRDYLDAGDRQVLTVSTDSPAATAPYLRLVALSEFDGTNWTAAPFEPAPERELNAGLPATVDGLADSTALPQRDYTVRVTALDGPYLPMPFPAIRQTIGGGWFADPATGTVFSHQFSSAGTVYTVTAVDTTTEADVMRARARAEPGASPPVNATAGPTPQIPEMVTTLARSITAGTDNNFDAAVALQEWFRSNFRYSTSVRSGSDVSYLQQFLTERVGYCEQFAATMALMAQSLGIPARVAVGFAPGHAAATPGSWTVSTHDAHAWPELWLQGSGWTRFEPTPRAGDGSAVAAPVYAQPGTVTGATAGSTARATRPTKPQVNGGADAVDREATSVDTAGSGAVRHAITVIVILGILGLLAVPLIVRVRRRHRRLSGDPRAAAHGAWDDLHDSVIDYGLAWSASDTPRQAGRRLVRQSALQPEAGAAIARLVLATEDASYRDVASVMPTRSATDARADLAVVRRAFGEFAPPLKRWEARLFPATGRRRAASRQPLLRGDEERIVVSAGRNA